MQKWEYLTLRSWDANFMFEPQGKADFASIAQTLPRTRVVLPQGPSGVQILVCQDAGRQHADTWQAVQDYLGSQGWEAYAVLEHHNPEQIMMFFKRTC